MSSKRRKELSEFSKDELIGIILHAIDDGCMDEIDLFAFAHRVKEQEKEQAREVCLK